MQKTIKPAGPGPGYPGIDNNSIHTCMVYRLLIIKTTLWYFVRYCTLVVDKLISMTIPYKEGSDNACISLSVRTCEVAVPSSSSSNLKYS